MSISDQSSSCGIEFDADLLESAVDRALRASMTAPYWRERSHIYENADVDTRNVQFAELARRTFRELGLEAPLVQALSEQPLIGATVASCRVIPAIRAQDEGAELLVPSDRQPPAKPTVRIRLRAESFAEPERLLASLRHELYHIADMLDPEFGYDPSLPELAGGPLAQKLAVDRYRVLWDTTIDGRLFRQGRAPESVHDVRRREFSRTFMSLGRQMEGEFARWFDDDRPTHSRLLRFACQPVPMTTNAPTDGPVASTVCPLCGFPYVNFESASTSVDDRTVRAIRVDFPLWEIAAGICPQCLELYRSRMTLCGAPSNQIVGVQCPPFGAC